MYEQRDIVLIPFPYSDLTGAKQRPALIISNKKVNKSEDRICCLITSKPSHEGVLIGSNSFEKRGLPFKSWVKPKRLFTIHAKIIRKKICTVNKVFFDRVLKSISECIKAD
jgi:mRNA interferase MazF